MYTIEKVTKKPKWMITAECKWAQRSNAADPTKNLILLTIDLPNVNGASSLDIQPNYLLFTAQTGRIGPDGFPESEYVADIKFFRPIAPPDTKITFTATSLVLLLRKEAAGGEFWPRLRLATNDVDWLKRDDAKWVDEDKQEGAPSLDGPAFVSVNTPGLGVPPPMCGMPPGKRKAKRKTIK